MVTNLRPNAGRPYQPWNRRLVRAVSCAVLLWFAAAATRTFYSVSSGDYCAREYCGGYRTPSSMLRSLAHGRFWADHTVTWACAGTRCDLTRIESWDGYRLGDVIRGAFDQHNERERAREIYLATWPDSLAMEYMNRTAASNDYDTLALIVRRRARLATADLPAPRTLVVHLRLGDVAENPMKGPDGKVHPPPSGEGLWEHGGLVDQNGRQYIKARSYYDKELLQVAPDIKRVVLVGSVYHDSNGKNMSNSLVYRNHVTDYFVGRGFDVQYRWDRLPDDDLVYMASASVFMMSGGGFSRLVMHCMKRLNGTVIGMEEVLNRNRNRNRLRERRVR